MAKKKSSKSLLTIEFEFEYEIFGLCSHHPDYRLAFEINKILHFSMLKSENEFIPDVKKGKAGSFSCFEYIDEDLGSFYLIKNKNEGKYLIPERDKIDFFFFAYQLNGIDLKKTIKSLNQIPVVLATFHFEADQLPSIETIHLDI